MQTILQVNDCGFHSFMFIEYPCDTCYQEYGEGEACFEASP